MSLFFPDELATLVEGIDGYIYISQESPDGVEDIIKLSIHQFDELFNRSKHLITDARGESAAE